MKLFVAEKEKMTPEREMQLFLAESIDAGCFLKIVYCFLKSCFFVFIPYFFFLARRGVKIEVEKSNFV